MSEKLKKEFIELLEKDKEFRYTVAGYLGLSEILKRLDRLEEGQNRLWEGQAKLWEEVKLLRVNYDRMRKYMVTAFRELRASLGVAFEDHAASFLELMLEEMGYAGARVERKFFVHGGEVVEVNLFCEKPLVVGEATVSVKDAREAEAEVEKLLKRVKIVEEKYGKPEMMILSVARSTDEAAKMLKDLAERHGVRLILGKEIEEELAI
jgi:SPX domain protein involved in polyphosphate accumulation